MTKFIIGTKIGMSQIFDEKGNVVPVTLIEAGPCIITQIKNKEKDGYQAIQLGFLKKAKKTKKTEKGKEYRYLKEFSVLLSKDGEGKDRSLAKIGDRVDLSFFQEGEKVKISGVSKGKGFQGGVKRWGFKGALSSSHGTKHEHRTIGSTGSRFPQRVIKGRKMPGRMGAERTTIKNLEVVKIDKENNLLAVKGAVPGPKGTLLEIKG